MPPREWIFLECSECGTRYYRTTKSTSTMKQAGKLELSKFCPKCRLHRPHKERKK
ncbi:MAG: 50S ribosomal protein L33 [Planctomycetes bacterium]|nr:50S ribosomal protein L33 [Planctomycetota bacterium]